MRLEMPAWLMYLVFEGSVEHKSGGGAQSSREQTRRLLAYRKGLILVGIMISFFFFRCGWELQRWDVTMDV